MNTINNQEIEEIRQRINTLDSSILSLLQKRLAYAKEIGHIKRNENKGKEDSLREKEIFQRLLAENDAIFPEKAVISIFKKIIETCKNSQ